MSSNPAELSKNDVLADLMSRRSHWPLQLPAPSDAELHAAFEVAMRAPDHASLRPWRFIVIRDDALIKLGEVFASAAIQRNATDGGKRSQSQALAAPMIIAVGAACAANANVPIIEQVISAGAAAMNLLNALHLLKYGAYWASGDNAYDRSVASALGLNGETDHLLGFIYVGSPVNPKRQKSRPSSNDVVTYWTGSLTR
ncbi:nitroreductase [Pseudomonas sp. W4I3]|uniref:nitroreductase family protein n=1 Tax=Pseudomonas sp. W4I3 TaxID=3042294 RepID=UPI002787E4DD|nr:nitroreductase [Pseudomonas sp. W4I3]MDQ0740307.1 nitroreductase [Pseudomonas sp. W4I3]